jgi:hypothetical protein
MNDKTTITQTQEPQTMNDQTTNLPATVPATTTEAAPVNGGAFVAINQYLDSEDPQTTVGKLLKFAKGEFLLGTDADVVPEGALYTVAADMTLTGWIRWKGGKPVEHKLVRIASGQTPFRREDLGHDDTALWETDSNGEPRDPWQQAIYVPVMNADGEVSTFTTGSKSGLKSVNRLLRRYATHAARHPEVYPLVKLKKDFWVHQDRSIGKIFFPDFEPAGWVPRGELAEALQMLGVDTGAEPQKALPSPKDEFNDSLDGF